MCWLTCLQRASRRAARFVRFGDAFNIPIVTSGRAWFLPAPAQEYVGLSTRGEAAVRLSPCTVPLVTLIRARLRRAYDVMASANRRRRELCLAPAPIA